MTTIANIGGGRRLGGGSEDYVSFELTGAEEAQIKCRKIRLYVRRALRLLADRYGTEIKRRAQASVPVDTGALRSAISKRLARRAPTAKVISGSKGRRIYYGSFVELGTVRQRPRYFLRAPAKNLKAAFRADARATIKSALMGRG